MPLQAEGRWPEPPRTVDSEELATLCRLTIAEVEELVDYGALVPDGAAGGGGLRFGSGCLGPLREALELRARFDLDLFTVALLLQKLQRIAELEQQLRALQAHLPHRTLAGREGPADWREPHPVKPASH